MAAGINRSEEDIAAGNNLNCRVFAITDSFGLHYERAVKTVQSLSGDEYMRSCCFSLPDGKILAVGSSEGEIVLLRWPSLSPFTSLGGGGGIVDPFSTSNGQVSSSPGTVNLKDEIVDVSFSSSTTAASTSTNPSSSFSLLACCARSKCLILGLQHQQGKTHSLITLDPPPHLTGSKDKKCEFRASRYVPSGWVGGVGEMK